MNSACSICLKFQKENVEIKEKKLELQQAKLSLEGEKLLLEDKNLNLEDKNLKLENENLKFREENLRLTKHLADLTSNSKIIEKRALEKTLKNNALKARCDELTEMLRNAELELQVLFSNYQF